MYYFLPMKVATFDCSFKSQITTFESEVPVPNISPSGWNCPVVKELFEVWPETYIYKLFLKYSKFYIPNIN